MQTDRIIEVAELSAKLARQQGAKVLSAYTAASDAYKIASLASRLRRLYEQECNNGSTPELDAKQERIQYAVNLELGGYGLKANFNGDPRGYAVYIHFPDGSYNTMGGQETGWGI